MEIRRPNKQRGSLSAGFDPVVIGVPDASSAPAQAALGQQPRACSDPYLLAQSAEPTKSAPATCFRSSIHSAIDHSAIVGLAESASIPGNLASAIAETFVTLLKQRADSMTIALVREAEKLLGTSQQWSPSSRPRSAESSQLDEEGLAEQSHGPDESLLPMPVFALSRTPTPSSERFPLPSIIEEVSRDEKVGPGPVDRQPASLPVLASDSSAKRVDLSNEGFQRDLQRAAVSPLWHPALEASTGDRLPKSVTGAWRRQAAILGRNFRKHMEEDVAMAKSNTSFRGGLWWLQNITGVRSLSKPKRAACVSACLLIVLLATSVWHFQQLHMASRSMLSALLELVMLSSSMLGLVIHHAYFKLSDNCPTTGEQDAMLQSHSVAFGYTQEWLTLSRKQGWYLLFIWLISITASCGSYTYKAQSLPQESRVSFIVTGALHFAISSGIICALCMRVIHMCSAMKIALISCMQQFTAPSVDFIDMVHEWNAIQIFTRTSSDGCAPSLACQVAMVPAVVGSALLQTLLASTSVIELFVTSVPFFIVSAMPYFALLCAADTSMQCGQAAEVANSLLVGQLMNPVAQSLLNFMARCNLGVFINDLRISPGGVMKYTYILVVVFVTVVSSVIEPQM